MNLLLQRRLTALFIPLVFAACALAEGPAGVGSDVWTSYMERQNLFSPHYNLCDSSEAFIAMTTVPSVTGFCMEKSERGAKTWLAARQTCVDLGKRLPELTEFQHACNLNLSPGNALTNMTDNLEWVSNYTYFTLDPGTSNSYVWAHAAGGSTCNYFGIGFVAKGPTGSSSTGGFRCVR